VRLIIFTSHPIQYQAPLFRALAARLDLEVLVVFSYVPAPKEQGLGFGRPIVWDVPVRGGFDSVVAKTIQIPGTKPGFFHRLSFDFGRHIANFKPDVALMLGWHDATLMQAYLACQLRGIPLIMRGESNALRTRGSAAQAFHRLYMRGVRSVLAIGDSNRKFFEHAGIDANKIATAKYFIDNETFAKNAEASREQSDATRVRWQIPPDAFVALFAGKLEAKKRVMDFLEALRLARDSGAKVHGLVVGDGEEKDEAVRFAAAHQLPCTFAGFLNQTEMPFAYAIADSLILPSDYGETWGLVVNEAMACGVPAIVSDHVGCANDLVIQGVTGAVVPFATPQAIADTLSAWANDRDAQGQIAQAARQHVMAGYTIDLAVSGLLEAITFAVPGASKGSAGGMST
jgi:glycosyltransferase involved in cell wall biosynthesis